MIKVLAILVLAASALEESNVELHLKPKGKLNVKAGKVDKALSCQVDDKEVPRTSNGPRRVKFEETQENGYFSKPELKKIFYLNQDYDSHRNAKLQAALHATVGHTAAGNESTIEIERFKAFIPRDVEKNKKQAKLSQFSSFKFDAKEGADLKVVAIYLTHAS